MAPVEGSPEELSLAKTKLLRDNTKEQTSKQVANLVILDPPLTLHLESNKDATKQSK
jgi:hypothetical protein